MKSSLRRSGDLLQPDNEAGSTPAGVSVDSCGVTAGSHTELLTPYGASLRWFDPSRRSLVLFLPCDAAGVATCLSSRGDGFESRTGRFLRAVAERLANLCPDGETEIMPRFQRGRSKFGASFSCCLHFPPHTNAAAIALDKCTSRHGALARR
jgi:hypothetical protein